MIWYNAKGQHTVPILFPSYVIIAFNIWLFWIYDIFLLILHNILLQDHVVASNGWTLECYELFSWIETHVFMS